ncbi:MAG: response regulator transcription factor [Lachnospiraceae bacterium]|nr:response regulator transcription factor [Lachnospiraceae bacterium]MDD3659881.1 response regulator transcription factor [Lachnospiraceae bacterium]
MAEHKVLIIDDEPGIRDMIKEYLLLEEYETVEAIDGVDGINQFKNQRPDMVILDVMLPKLDGWKVCREIRNISDVPIIMLTARGEEYDKLFGFELGIDDYMVKPFSPKELLARIKAIYNRRIASNNQTMQKNLVVFGEITVDLDARSAYHGGTSLSMTPKEFDLLVFFVTHPGKVFSREQLLDQVWGFDFYGDIRTVDTHVKMLRETLGTYRKCIVTAWGIGYKFQMEENT